MWKIAGLYFEPRRFDALEPLVEQLMNVTSSATTILTNLGVQFPTIAVCFLGLVLALMQMQRQPRVASMVAAALGFLLFVSLVQSLLQPVINNIILREMGRVGMNVQSHSLMFSGVAFGFNVLRAIAFGVLAYAAFVDRPRYGFAAAANPHEIGKPFAPPK
jgi:hypothetical protein